MAQQDVCIVGCLHYITLVKYETYFLYGTLLTILKEALPDKLNKGRSFFLKKVYGMISFRKFVLVFCFLAFLIRCLWF